MVTARSIVLPSLLISTPPPPLRLRLLLLFTFPVFPCCSCPGGAHVRLRWREGDSPERERDSQAAISIFRTGNQR